MQFLRRHFFEFRDDDLEQCDHFDILLYFSIFYAKLLTNHQKSDIIIMSKKYISCIHYTLKTNKKQGQL
nr:MAG TPA: hypothetical protein [Caudoviricetes sp.]